ncbi:MAG: glycosyltransferase family 2 protein [Flavobacteriales bacterium]
MNGLVSVIIPAYNTEKYITGTILSVQNQTYKDIEIIVVNDGSTDNTVEIVKNLVLSDPRITLYSKKNTGVSDTRNFGIEKAKGNFIAFLDADDCWMENNLQKKINVLLNNSSVDFVFSDAYLTDENLNITAKSLPGKDENLLDNILLWEGEVIPYPCSNLVLKKRCLENPNVRFHKNLSNVADQHFCVLLAKNFNGQYIREYLWFYRVLSESMSKSLSLLEKDSIKAYQIYKESNLFKSSRFKRRCFSNMYLMLAISWWKNGNNKLKGLKFFSKSILCYPPNLIRVFRRILRVS